MDRWVLVRVALALALAMLALRPAAAAEVEYLLVSTPHDLLSTLGLTSGAGARPPVDHLLVLFPPSSSPTDGRDRQYAILFFSLFLKFISNLIK
jgi:hypothetical protein